MLFQLGLPHWVNKHIITFNSIDEIPGDVFTRISLNLAKIQSDNPVVSICVIGYNEEKCILNCLSSLSEQVSSYPIEIIISNNNSKDRMQELLDRVGVRSVIEKRQGVGWARQTGLDLSKGKYVLNADADVIYPPTWVDEFVKYLENPKISGVFSVDSYIPDAERGRWNLAFYEFSRDLSIYMRGYKRPELNVGGGSFGFRAEQARTIGWKTNIKRGEDGSMAFNLKKFGKIKFINNSRARVWSTTRSLQDQGNLITLVFKRLGKEFNRFREYFIAEKVGYKDRESNLIKKQETNDHEECI
jgi:glycosyltransferase involved in cell wall biosynthesis